MIFSFPKKQNNGLTIIELLVAISVLTIVTALIIPRLRLVNEDRNIREAARVVGSAFSLSRDRAIGTRLPAGVTIERNLNFVARTMNGTGNRVFYAGTRLTQLEAIFPKYRGDNENDFVVTTVDTDSDGNPTLQCLINLPLEHDPANGFHAVLPCDEIEIDEHEYVIKEVLAPRTINFQDLADGFAGDLCGTNVADGSTLSIVMLPLNILFDDDNNPNNTLNTMGTTDYFSGEPAPQVSMAIAPDTFQVGGTLAVQVEKFSLIQLRKNASSSVDLPPGYLVDLRYSGPLDADNVDSQAETVTMFGLAIDNAADSTAMPNREVRMKFHDNGQIDAIFTNGVYRRINRPINLFVNEFNPDELATDTTAQAQVLLNKPNALWVTIGTRDGTNVVYSTPPGNDTVDVMITSASQFTRNGSSAVQ